MFTLLAFLNHFEMLITSSFGSLVLTSVPNPRTLSHCLLEICTEQGACMTLFSFSCFPDLSSANAVILFPRQRPLLNASLSLLHVLKLTRCLGSAPEVSFMSPAILSDQSLHQVPLLTSLCNYKCNSFQQEKNFFSTKKIQR